MKQYSSKCVVVEMLKFFLPAFPIIFNTALQGLHTISLYVERVRDLMNVQIKILQQKSEKTEEEKADVPVILKLKAEQVRTKMEIKLVWFNIIPIVSKAIRLTLPSKG